MDRDQFWRIVEQSVPPDERSKKRGLAGWLISLISRKPTADQQQDHQQAALAATLTSLPAMEIAEFQRHFDELHSAAYRWDLWGAAYIMGGGCSDDGFLDFRSWLISRGQRVYDAALMDAESLADIDVDIRHRFDYPCFFEAFAYVATEVYERKTGGSEMPRTNLQRHDKPHGEEWSEEGDDLQRRFPKLWKRFGGWAQ